MHGNILNQRINFFLINAYRDHSKLEENHVEPAKELVELDPWGDLFNNTLISKIRKNGRMLDLRPKSSSKKNANFFYSKNGDWDSVTLTPYFRKSNTFATTNTKHLKEHYNRALSEVVTVIVERNITLTDNHLSIRTNRYTKSRGLNAKYFKKNSITNGVKFNLKTGSFITYSTNGTRRTRTNKIRQNSFRHLSDVIRLIFENSQTFSDMRVGDNLEQQYKEQINDKVFEKTLYHTISSLLDVDDYAVVNPSREGMIEFTVESLIKLFIKTKGIKVPNDYIGYLVNWYPTQKYLKKNENKLILAILDRLKLKTKSLNRLLHEIPEANIANLITLSKLFGYNDIHKYIHNLDKRFLSVKTSPQLSLIGQLGYESLNNHFEYSLSTDEKSRLLKLLNSFFNNNGKDLIPESGRDISYMINQQFIQITDHMSMIAKIKEYFPETELRAQNFKDFHHEHIEYSKTERLIQKGYTIQYTFDDKLIKHIEEPIQPKFNIGLNDAPAYATDMDKTSAFYPVILKTDGEYSEEGKHMHHCVGSYSDKEQSLIVSIREGSSSGEERVTCEFDAKTRTMIQAKSFCNAKPPERFEIVVKALCDKINTFRGSIKSLGKEKIPLVINGIQIPLKEEAKSTLEFLMEEIDRVAQNNPDPHF